jgi:hypothetical protein
MTRQITPQEWEAISAYLDGELAPKERQRLELRLKDQPELRSALEELRRIRTVLRSQTMLRAPRNFTLTPQMAGIRTTGGRLRPAMGAFSLLRLSSVLATIFFLVVLVGDLAAGKMRPTMLPQQQVSNADAPAPMAIWGMGGGGGGGGAEEATTGQVIAEGQVITAEGDGPAMGKAAPPEAGDTALAVTPLGMAVAETPQPPMEGESMRAVAPKEAPGAADQVAPGAPGESREAEREDGSRQTGWPVLRVLQVLLAVLAVGTGLAAFYLRRSAGG